MKRVKFAALAAALLTGTVAVSGEVSYIITKKLVELALDRGNVENQESIKKLLSGETNTEIFARYRDAAAENLINTPHETVSITARDGVKLVGHFVGCTEPKRAIIAMHGWRSSWAKDFGMISDFLHENACAVLYAEQRGQNESGGSYMGFGLTERFDCLDWINWLNGSGYDTFPLYLCGVSMGAATVLMASGFTLPENVHGIIADCGYTSPYAIWKHIAENNLHLRYDKWMRDTIDEMCRERINFSSDDFSCTKALESCRVPVLFIHGTDDNFVPIEMTYENYKYCDAPKRLLVVPGAGHGMSYAVDKARYEQTVLQFWQDYDSMDKTQ